ncbi:unnamed protein product [Fusarium graminearum]|nr:unnamed protein product [Fusarium graminearum]
MFEAAEGLEWVVAVDAISIIEVGQVEIGITPAVVEVRTTPLFREVPVEVKGGGFGAAGEGEGLLEKV